MENHIIFGLHITDRLQHAAKVQELLTEYGGHIKTRLGLHETDGRPVGSPNGLMILEMIGDADRCGKLAQKLNAIGGIEVQRMDFSHD